MGIFSATDPPTVTISYRQPSSAGSQTDVVEPTMPTIESFLTVGFVAVILTPSDKVNRMDEGCRSEITCPALELIGRQL